MESVISHRKVCPLVADPQPDCFCASLTSQRIVQVMNYCCDRFVECAIFLRLHPEGGPEPSAAVEASAEGQGEEK